MFPVTRPPQSSPSGPLACHLSSPPRPPVTSLSRLMRHNIFSLCHSSPFSYPSLNILHPPRPFPGPSPPRLPVTPVTPVTSSPSVLPHTHSPFAVVEVFSDWCGPSTSIVNTLKKFYFDYSSKDVKFYTCNSSKIEDLKEYKSKSEPVFLLFVAGKLESTVVGCDLPKLNSAMETLVQRPECSG